MRSRSFAARAACAALAAAMLSAAAPAGAQTANGAAWPQFLGDHRHSSFSQDPAITNGNASTFGLKWMANLYNTDLGSPVVAFNSTLNKNVVYVGNQRADVFAIDAATGKELWSTNLGINDKIEDTPMVAPDGTVWVGTSFNPTMYKLDGATGKIDCSVKAALPIDGSPMYTVPAGGVPTVFWNYIDSNSTQGPTIATNESNCAQIFVFSQYNTHAGSWTTPAYGYTKSGEPLVIVGTADTDSTEYAIDANTGAKVWSFAISNPPPGFYDIGDGATISDPNENNIADGVVYVSTKAGDQYALDMSTGLQMWTYHMDKTEGIASSALDGNTLVTGYQGGLYSFNATTGAVNWHVTNPAPVDSSPSIIGPKGSEVVTFGDLGGGFHVIDLATGNSLYKAQTGGYITSSTAEANGTVYIASSDGFLYAYGPGGSNQSAPSSAVTSPADLSKIPNPNGNVTISGTASDASGVNAVEVAVQAGGSAGAWYDASTNSYNPAPVRNLATLANPGAQSTTWTFTMPAPASGGNFEILASAVNTGKVVNKAAVDNFTISPSKGEPNISLSASTVAPGASFTASSTGFKAGEQVVFTFQGNTVATVTATSNGHVPTTTIKVPTTSTFGPTTLTLTGQSSGKTTSATIDVTNNWTQFGHDASRTDMEPHDPVINASLSIGNGTVLNQSWYYQAGAAVNTTPAVVGGVAYFGNDAGVLTALVVNAGSPQWTYSVPGGAAIKTSPAVDSNKTITFGATDGNLYTVSPTGSLVRSIAIGGNIAPPVADNGQLFVASDNRHLYNIVDSTGSIAWTDTMPAAIHAPPSYDVTAKTVVAGDDSGAITAVNSTTGAQIWRVSTGGPITAAPMIYNGVVYAGSGDGHLYALKESTGAVLWKVAADSAITAGPSLYTATVLNFGTQKGSVYQVTTSGKIGYTLTSQFGGSPIVGLSNVEGNTMVNTADGSVRMIRIVNNAFIAWSTKTGAGLTTEPVIVDGTVYIGADDGGVYAFTPQGANPLAKVRRPTVTITDSNTWACTTP